MDSVLLRSPQGKPIKLLIVFILAILGGIVLSLLLHFKQWQDSPPLAGGETTVFNRSSSGYEQPLANLTPEEVKKHTESDRAFEAIFVTAPAPVHPGLGPVFNNASCAGCHLRNGRGLPEPGQLLVRVSGTQATALKSDGTYYLEGSVALDNAPPVAGLGTQIQDQAIYGKTPEAKVEISWQEQSGQYGDGTPYTLRSPKPKITLPNGKFLPADVRTSLRIPPPVFGLGLLEAVPEETLLKVADPDDKNQDGISGQANQVWDAVKNSEALGRFGWKAGNPTLIQQNAGAYVNDMGITNPVFPDVDGSTDIDETILNLATYYVQTLAVPSRTFLDDPQVKRGEKLFNQANCVSCHLPTLKTGNHEIKALANQTIHPYTDLLLHDIGEGLADKRPDFKALGTEWRTPALWGIGLTQTVLPYSSYLHDGRARTLEEAILWHSGEAEASKEAFRNLEKSDREAFVKFLRSL